MGTMEKTKQTVGGMSWRSRALGCDEFVCWNGIAGTAGHLHVWHRDRKLDMAEDVSSPIQSYPSSCLILE